MPRALAIELSDADAKAVVLSSSKSGPRVDFAGQEVFEPAARDEQGAAVRADAIRTLLKAAGGRFSTCALVAPKQCATVRRVRLPSGDPDEIAQMAQFEAEKLIPFNVERHIIGFSVLEQDGVEGSDVLIAAVDEPVMESWSLSAEKAGVEPAIADVSSLSLAYGFTHTMGQSAKSAPIALIHVGLVHTDITFLRDGLVVTTASVGVGVNALARDLAAAMPERGTVELDHLPKLNLGAADPVAGLRPAGQGAAEETPALEIVEDEPTGPAASDPAQVCTAWLNKLMTNLKRTYEFALREYSLPSVDTVYLSGDGVRIGGLKELLEQQLGAELFLLDPFGDRKPQKVHGGSPPASAFGPAYGAALRLLNDDEEGGVNLLPDRLFEKTEARERRTHYGITGMMVVVFLALVFLAWDANRLHVEEQFDRFVEFNEQLEPLVEDISDKSRRMQIITDHVRPDKAGILPILEAVSSYENIGTTDTGGRVALTDVKYEMGRTLEFSGLALESDDISDLVYYLDSLQYDSQKLFTRVDIRNQNTTTLPRRSQTIYSFQITASLEASR